MSKKLVRFDWAIKKLLRNKINFVVLEGFLSELLFEDIKIQKDLVSQMTDLTITQKNKRVVAYITKKNFLLIYGKNAINF